MGLDDDHLHSHRSAEQVDHLLVRQSGHGDFADLHEAAPLAKASLPGKAKGKQKASKSFPCNIALVKKKKKKPKYTNARNTYR